MGIWRRGARVRRYHPDGGFALVAVVGMMLVLMLFALGSLAFALQNMDPSRRDQDAKSALAAAQAGIDDYISRLNVDRSYYNLGNTDASNAAFTPAGRPIPGTSGVGSYRYEVLTTAGDTISSGYVRLKSTGESRGISRTLTARLSPKGFLDFIYHTDKENQDPAIYAPGNAAEATKCSKYYYQGRTGCREIQFTTGDTINGPLHTNDALQIGGAPMFTDPKTESSWSNPPDPTKRWWGNGTPVASGYRPVYKPVVQIPPSNAGLIQYADPAQGGPGCLYTGATKITFTGGTMTVLSPNTTTAPARCYNTSAVDKATPQAGLTIPPVIYVQDLTGPCARNNSGVTIGLGYPLSGEYTGSSYVGPNYSCNKGTAYVQGTMDGQATIASAQDIMVTADLKYQDASATSNDIMGLIPNHFAWVYHPIDRYGDNMLSTPVLRIDAAILATLDSFGVQNYAYGDPISYGNHNKLIVYGAIAQNFRGPVGTGNSGTVFSGYLKDYRYDTRFARGAQPPYFLQPVSTQWRATQVSDG